MTTDEYGAPVPPHGLDADYLTPETLARIQRLTAFLDEIETGDGGQILGMGIAVTGRLEITYVQQDEYGHADDDSPDLIGWVQPHDTGAWGFVPCVPHLHWSPDQQRWVNRDDIRAENQARRESTTT